MRCALYALCCALCAVLRAVRAAQLVSANCAARFVLRCAHIITSWAERRDICVISQFVVVVVNLPYRV